MTACKWILSSLSMSSDVCASHMMLNCCLEFSYIQHWCDDSSDFVACTSKFVPHWSGICSVRGWICCTCSTSWVFKLANDEEFELQCERANAGVTPTLSDMIASMGHYTVLLLYLDLCHSLHHCTLFLAQASFKWTGTYIMLHVWATV